MYIRAPECQNAPAVVVQNAPADVVETDNYATNASVDQEIDASIIAARLDATCAGLQRDRTLVSVAGKAHRNGVDSARAREVGRATQGSK